MTQNDSSLLPLVVLIGDSIRGGYEPYVRQLLKNEMEVWGPKQNGGNSRNVLSHLEEWAIERQPALVHINCGLHDLRREFNESENAVPLSEYSQNVRAILERIQSAQIPVIWATTTPVNEKWHHENKEFDRFEADVQRYNEAALAVVNELGIPVDDLFSVVQPERDNYLLPDGVHFTEEASSVLADAVAQALRERAS